MDFWKIVKWGATVVIVVVTLASIVVSLNSEGDSAPTQAAQPGSPTTKFNF